MEARQTESRRFAWKLLVYSALAFATVALTFALCSDDIPSYFFYCLLLIPISLVLFVWVVLWTFVGRGRWL